MAFQLSPGVNVSEIDLTTIVPSVATSIGGIAGKFAWGPEEEITTISDEGRLAERFGKPDSTNYEYWFTAASFLAYSGNLKVIRISANGSLNATTTGSVGLRVKNDDQYENQYSSDVATWGPYISKYPGVIGNSLKVGLADAAMYSAWAYKGNFTSQPGTSTYVANVGGSFDELHAIVLDEFGAFSGTANTVLEVFPFMSKAKDAKDDSGNANYYKDVINKNSRYIRYMSHPISPELVAGNWGNAAASVAFANLAIQTAYSMANGSDGGSGASTLTANTTNAYALFSNADTVDVNLILGGPSNATNAAQVITIAETRKDAMAYISVEKADVVNNAFNEATASVEYRNTLTSSSYAVIDCNWKYMFDKYNDVYRWVPCNGDTAGLTARTDLERDPWFSPAGPNRGIMRNVLKLAWNPVKTERDTLYSAGINPIITFPGEGTQLFGDKTMLSKPSAFDRINVRRLFIVIEKAIARAARFSMFEFNDQFTRSQFVSLVEPYLRDIQGRRGITDFKVVCDESNNTGEVIDSNRFVGDIYIKPARSINFIQLNFVAVRTGVSFDEVVGQF